MKWIDIYIQVDTQILKIEGSDLFTCLIKVEILFQIYCFPEATAQTPKRKQFVSLLEANAFCFSLIFCQIS